MSVHSAATVSKTRMRPSDTRTHFTFVAIHGHVQPSPHMTGHSTIRQIGQEKQTRADTAARSFPDQEEALEMDL